MTSKTVKYNNLKINLDESKTPKSSMPLITTGFNTTKRRLLTKNILSSTVKSNNQIVTEEKNSYLNKINSSRSESRNNNPKYTHSQLNSPSNNNKNYGSLIASKNNSSNDEFKIINNNYTNNTIYNISPHKTKKYNIFNNIPIPSLSTQKHFHSQSTRSNVVSKASQPEAINIMTLLSNQNSMPINISTLKATFPNYDPAKTSLKSLSSIRGYGVNTNQGIVR